MPKLVDSFFNQSYNKHTELATLNFPNSISVVYTLQNTYLAILVQIRMNDVAGFIYHRMERLFDIVLK